MKNFRRSLKYLWPYRRRLALSAVLVFLIAVLWGGGLGALLPGLKILIAPEGLHGWAWNSMMQDRLQARLVRQEVQADTRIDGLEVGLVLGVAGVEKDGPAEQAGIRPGDWIVGTEDADPTHRVMPWRTLARMLALSPTGQELVLRLYNPGDGQAPRTVRARMGEARFGASLLGRIARAIPEPLSYPGRFPILLGLLIFVLLINYLRNLLRFAQEYLVHSAVLRGLLDLRSDNYNVALRLPVVFFSEKGTSDTMSRFVRDTNELGSGQITLFGKTLVEPAKAAGSLVAALLLSWQLTLLVTVVGPPVIILIRRFGRRVRRASRRALESWSAMLGVLEETLAGIRVVKSYTMEGAERRRLFRVNRKLLGEQKKMARIEAASSPIVEALGITGGAAATAVAGYLVLNSRMDPYVFITWLGCLAALFDPVRKLAKVATRFHRAEAAAARVFELQDRQQEKRVPNAPMLPRHSQSIEFRNVCFRYPNTAENALKNINLTVRARETVAIVGPNGSGKTTLISLLPRLLDPTEGAVLIDGHDISMYSLRSLRRQIGVVTQETVLFNASIAENIGYGLRRPKQAAVLAAAAQAYVDDFVAELPNGYDTLVGEHGARLSGGQRQRVTIARAILRDPAILIFDEALSQVDPDSERKIHEALTNFRKGRTTLLVAHRLATVLEADRIIVMHEGRIADTGRHNELLRRCGLYRQLYQTQLAPNEGG